MPRTKDDDSFSLPTELYSTFTLTALLVPSLLNAKEPQLEFPLLRLFALGFVLCPTAQCLLGKTLYRRVRVPLVSISRLLITHACVQLHPSRTSAMLGAAQDRSLLQLLSSSLSLHQLLFTICWPLPAHVQLLVTLLSAADYLRTIPAACPAPPPGAAGASMYLWLQRAAVLATQGARSPPSAVWMVFFQQLASWLDLPILLFLGKGRAGAELVSGASEASLCTAVLAWAHLTVAVAGSTVMSHVVQWWCRAWGRGALPSNALWCICKPPGGAPPGRGARVQGQQHGAQRGMLGSSSSSKPRSPGWLLLLLRVCCDTMLCMLCIGVMLWCVLRVVTTMLL